MSFGLLCGFTVLLSNTSFTGSLDQPATTAAARMQAIIDDVQANEKLYDNLSVTYKEEYDYKLPANPTKGDPDWWMHTELTRETVDHYPRFYFKEDFRVATLGGKALHEVSIQAFDGEQTRYRRESVYNLHTERVEPCALFRPHNWMLSRAFMCFPLSVWLQGGAVLKNHPRADSSYKESDQKCTFEKEETFQGLRCKKIRCENWTMGTQAHLAVLSYLWLAPEKNYLPVKLESFTLDVSKDIPVLIGVASDFREISPGIWLSFARTLELRDSWETRAQKKPVIAGIFKANVVSAEKDPMIDDKKYKDVPFPEEGMIFEIKDGKIIKKYPVKERTPAKGAFWERSWWATAFLLVLLIGTALWLLQRKRKH
jgi:hypothetical protein